MSSFLATVSAAAMPYADSFDHHHDFGDGWWVVMAIGMLVFWAVVVAGGIWLVRELSSGRRPRSRSAGGEAIEILDRRLADGSISVEEYEQRRRALRDADEGAGDGG